MITEVFILVPALVGLKGNLEMTLAARLSTAVRTARMLFTFTVDLSSHHLIPLVLPNFISRPDVQD